MNHIIIGTQIRIPNYDKLTTSGWNPLWACWGHTLRVIFSGANGFMTSCVDCCGLETWKYDSRSVLEFLNMVKTPRMFKSFKLRTKHNNGQ